MTDLRSNGSFVRLFLGGLVTNAGDSVYFIAAMWLVHDLTGSTFFTGLAGFLVQGPSALGFLVGPLVDRWRLRSILVSTQFVQGVSVLLVPLAAFLDLLSVWVVLVLMPVLTFVNQFVYASQSAVLPQIVPDEQLVRANSMMSTALQGLDMFFNGASGVVIAAIGAVSLYVIDSVTFLVAALLFVGISVAGAPGDVDDETAGDDESVGDDEAAGVGESAGDDEAAGVADDVEGPGAADDPDLADETPTGDESEVTDGVAIPDGADVDPADESVPAADGSASPADEATATADDPSADEGADGEAEEEAYLDQLREGVGYIRGSALAPMLLGLTVVNFMFGTGLAVFPAFAAARGGPEVFGFFMAAFAAGNLVGALGANFVDDLPFGLFNATSKVAAGVLLAGAVLVESLLATMGLLFGGFVLLGMGVVMSSSLRQSAVSDDLLGRVSSVSQSVSTAMLPVGSLVGGVVAAFVGVDAILVGVAASISLFGLYFLVHPRLRALPPVGEADEAALGL